MTRVYMAGAMSCYGTDEGYAKEWRKRVEDWFARNTDNVKCINPMDYYSYSHDISQSDIEVMRFDLHKVKTSDVVLVNCKDLFRSIGTSDEILYAYLNGIPVIGFVEDEKDLQTIHSWKYSQMLRVEFGDAALEKACEYIRGYYGEI